MILERDLLEWLIGFRLFRVDVIMKELVIVLSDESHQLQQITHTVPFKSISAAHQKNYQHPLEKAYVNLHEHDKPVNVRIWPEP